MRHFNSIWKLCWLLILAIAGVAEQAESHSSTAPVITDVQIRRLQGDNPVSFRLALLGRNLGDDDHPAIFLDTENPAVPVRNIRVESITDDEIVVSGEASPGTQIVSIRAVVRGTTTSPNKFHIDIAANPPPPELNQFQITFEHKTNKTFPNLHSVLVKKAGGNSDVGFDSNPNHMHVELSPPGITDLKVVDANREQMELHFIAAEDYEPANVQVTIYDSSDLDQRRPVAVAQPAPAGPAEDPNQPTIDRVETVFLLRSQGKGRLRIYGKGFGTDYGSAPYPVDDYLTVCVERPRMEKKSDKPDERTCALKNACRALTGNTDDLQNPDSPWVRRWEDIRKRVTVAVASRNTDLRIEKVIVLDISDTFIDVYFEFMRVFGYSMPFRLGGVNVVIQKTLPQTTQQVTTDKVTATVTGPVVKSYNTPHPAGLAADMNLTYRYTVLDNQSANVLLGRGISENFYVLQVAVVNSGDKKVSIPLAAIQAEVEWARGSEHSLDTKSMKDTNDSVEIYGTPQKVSYLEGPPTVSPATLAAVSAYFDAYQKTKGKRAILYNVLDGLTMFGTALVPYAGPSFKDAQSFFSGGFVPSLHKAMGDISGQQLQNLTALSWQNSETIAPGGGSLEKLIYIQKNAQFTSQAVVIAGEAKVTKKQITALLDLDITGYAVSESPGQQATSTTSPQSTSTTGTGNNQ